MKNNIVKILLVISLVTILSFTTFVLADVGNINRYTQSNDSDGGFSISGPIGIVVVILVVVIVIMYGKSKGKIKDMKDITDINKMQDVFNDLKSNVMSNVNGANVMSKEQILQSIHTDDPAFSEENFLAWARDVFIKIQQAWSTRDWKIIRPFESNELFEQHSAQLQEYINNNKINIIERVAVNSTNLVSYKVDGDKDIISINLSANMKDYIVDATTRKVLEGDPNRDYRMRYTLTFTRKHGVKTVVGTSNKSTTNCPNCGAPTQITSAGQCEYCNSVITTGEHDWVLTNITGKNS